MRTLRVLGLSAALAALVGCGDSDPVSTGGAGGEAAGGAPGGGADAGGGGAGGEAVDPLGPWTFEEVEVDGLPAVWGGIGAQESPTVVYLAGGVRNESGPTLTSLVRVEQQASGVVATTVSDQLAARYCGCALVDPGRQEAVVIGGRNGGFMETATAELVDLTTGAVTMLDAGEAKDHPVGCHAVFLPDLDVGYVFGGASQATGFDGRLFRYDPADHSFTLVDTPDGPPARYDGVLRYPLEGGPVMLVAGMGAGAKLMSDVWALDPATETWAEVSINGEAPGGRRLPWVAFAGNGAELVMGFGSNSPTGQSQLGDLWRLDLTAGAWSEIAIAGDPPPNARGFATWLPGLVGSAGLLSGGLGPAGAGEPALVARPPVPGDYR